MTATHMRPIVERRFKRIDSSTSIEILIADMPTPIKARFSDWSAAGAKCSLDTPVALPAEFEIRRVTPGGSVVTLRCDLKWQRDLDAGITFIAAH